MSNYANTIRRSLFISFAGRYSVTVLQFVSVMILARLLTPEDIGIYTVGLVLIGIAHMIRDFGIGKYLIQEKNLTKAKVGAALSLTIFISWFLGILIFFLAPHIAAYFEEPSVAKVTRVVALNFFIIPLGSMAPALLRRSMSFGTLFKINVTSSVISVVVGISMAYVGYGYMSMAWASVAGSLATALMAQFYMPEKYRTLPKLKNLGTIMNFGRHVVGSNLLQEIDSSVLNMMVGKYLGFATLGFLSRGQGYEKIYWSIIQRGADPVIHAHLAQQYRSGAELQSSFSYTLNFVTIIGWFSLGFIGLMSANLVPLLYGDQWDAAIPVASMLCLIGCLRIAIELGRRFFDSTGRVRINFRLSVVMSVCQIAVVLSLVKSGLTVLLIGLLLVSILNLILTYSVIFIRVKFSLWPLVKIGIINISIIAISLIVPAYLSLNPPETGVEKITDIIFAAIVSVASWLVLIVLSKHPLSEEIKKFGSMIIKRFSAR